MKDETRILLIVVLVGTILYLFFNKRSVFEKFENPTYAIPQQPYNYMPRPSTTAVTQIPRNSAEDELPTNFPEQLPETAPTGLNRMTTAPVFTIEGADKYTLGNHSLSFVSLDTPEQLLFKHQ